MHFRRSRNEDIEQILAIIEDARQFLASQQIDQWQGPYPDRTRIEEDIRLDISYVLEDSEVVGTAVLSFEPEECYRHIVGGAWLTEGENYGVIHRIAVQSAVRGKGYARRLLQSWSNWLRKREKKVCASIPTRRTWPCKIRCRKADMCDAESSTSSAAAKMATLGWLLKGVEIEKTAGDSPPFFYA